MKKYDIVRLINSNDRYRQYNLYLGAQGIILETNNVVSKVLFLNKDNQGDYAYIQINNEDLLINTADFSVLFRNCIKSTLKTFSPIEKGFKKK